MRAQNSILSQSFIFDFDVVKPGTTFNQFFNMGISIPAAVPILQVTINITKELQGPGCTFGIGTDGGFLFATFNLPQAVSYQSFGPVNFFIAPSAPSLYPEYGCYILGAPMTQGRLVCFIDYHFPGT